MTNEHKSASRAIVRALLKWFPPNARDLPWRRTCDPYAIWVSEIMLQQTQVRTVVPYFERWMLSLPDIAALAKCPTARLHKLWEGLGYYTRVRNLQRAAREIVGRHNGRFPTSHDQILELPGVGRYTAGAISSIAFNQSQAIVDGNVIRVLARLFAIDGNPRDKAVNERFWSLAGDLVAHAANLPRKVDVPGDRSALVFSGNCSVLNQSLMELGATICTATNPVCDRCPVRRHCIARRTEQVGRYPAVVRRPVATRRRFVAFIIRHGGRVLVRQRPAGVVNTHLWEFPNAEVHLDDPQPVASAATRLGLMLATHAPLTTIRHTITRYRITLDGHHATVTGHVPPSAGTWKAVRTLSSLAFTSAHGRLLRHWFAGVA